MRLWKLLRPDSAGSRYLVSVSPAWPRYGYLLLAHQRMSGRKRDSPIPTPPPGGTYYYSCARWLQGTANMHPGELWEHSSTWHRFNAGNNEYQLDMWMKVYEVQTSSYYFGDEAGVDAFLDPYAPVLNWRLQDDTTGSQNIHSGASSRYKSFGTANPAKDIWFTFSGAPICVATPQRCTTEGQTYHLQRPIRPA